MPPKRKVNPDVCVWNQKQAAFLADCDIDVALEYQRYENYHVYG